jgi:lysozyme
MLDRAVIDLSHHNADVDFVEMKNAGVVGVVHKATEGETYLDNTYHARRFEAQGEGLLWGAYHFLRPGDMAKQASFFVAMAGDADLYAADHEDAGVSLNDLKAFLAAVQLYSGKLCVIYSGHVLKEQLGGKHDPALARHRLWLAQYGTDHPTWPNATWPAWWLWQWTEHGDCPGVAGYVDCDRFDGNAAQLQAEWAGQPALTA